MQQGDQLFTLLAWMSPGFPVGAYSYSHGLEFAVEAGLVRSRQDLESWIGSVLRHGGGRNDGILLAAAWRAAMAGDSPALDEIAEIASAAAPTRELALETLAQGRAFADAVLAAWGRYPMLRRLRTAAEEGPAYPVAVGTACAEAGIARDHAVHAYLHAFASNIVSAGVRAVPLGQTDGQHVLAALRPAVGEVVADVADGDLDDLGGLTWMVEWCSMQHETQYTRLFRS